MNTVLAANYFGDNLAQGQAGPLGLVVIIALFIACWFLYRSMSKHMKRIPPTFDPPPEDSTENSDVDSAVDVELPSTDSGHHATADTERRS